MNIKKKFIALINNSSLLNGNFSRQTSSRQARTSCFGRDDGQSHGATLGVTRLEIWEGCQPNESTMPASTGHQCFFKGISIFVSNQIR